MFRRLAGRMAGVLFLIHSLVRPVEGFFQRFFLRVKGLPAGSCVR